MKTRPKRILHRGNVRDVVIVLSLVSAAFFTVDKVNIVVSLIVLAVGSWFNFVTKGTLVRETVLCDKGMYHLCRHPYYFSNFVIDISLCLLSGNIYLVLAYPFLFFWAYGPTFEEEETFLTERFSAQKDDYLLRRPQVFPCDTSMVSMKDILSEFRICRLTPYEIARLLRFWMVAILLIVVHEVSVRGIREAYDSSDMTLVVCGTAIIVMGLASAILTLMKKKKAAVATEDISRS